MDAPIRGAATVPLAPESSSTGQQVHKGSGWFLALTALGVVFGDIGTSPLYAFKTVLDVTGAHPDAETTLGALSLIVWTLIVVTSVKYVSVAMSIDNEGEGGILTDFRGLLESNPDLGHG